MTSCREAEFRRTPTKISFPEAGARLPTTWYCDFAIIEGRLNGGERLAFLLDTGAVHTMIDPRVAARWKDEQSDADRRMRASDGATVIGQRGLHVCELRLGEAVLRHFDCVVLDMTDMADALGRPLDGVLSISGCLIAAGRAGARSSPRPRLVIR